MSKAWRLGLNKHTVLIWKQSLYRYGKLPFHLIDSVSHKEWSCFLFKSIGINICIHFVDAFKVSHDFKSLSTYISQNYSDSTNYAPYPLNVAQLSHCNW